MKKILAIAFVLVVAAFVQSCSSSQKHCAAYTKHDAGDRPTYKEVQ